MKWTFLTIASSIVLALIIGAFVTARLPERPIVDSNGWHDGHELPPSYLIGVPLDHLIIETLPFRYNSVTAYYLIRGGVGGWYMALGEDTILMGFPDYWAEYPVVK